MSSLASESLAELFPESAPIVREAAEAQRMAWDTVPAKGAVYLLVTLEEGVEKPLMLATVGDLRAAIRRRLSDALADVKTRRVDYATLCTRLYWRRVDSSFAANWWYWRIARALFPATYAALVPWRSSWWIGVEREGPHPKLRRMTDLSDEALMYAGPVRDKHAAGRLIETVEDLFDLCRYHAELVQAPRGRACAYKEMGKCPAPCDGTVPLGWYRNQMMKAWGFLTGEARGAWFAENEMLMKAAAGRQEFEAANRIKQRLARAAVFQGGKGSDAFRLVRSLADFSFVTLQRGKGRTWIEPWVVHGGRVECLAQIQRKDLAPGLEGVAVRYREIAREPVGVSMDGVEIEQMAIAVQHLFRGEDDHGVWVSGAAMAGGGVGALGSAAEELLGRKAVAKPLVEQSSDAEGVAIETSGGGGV